MDAREIEKCIDEFGTDIYRFCLKLCMDKSEAEDLYQQTFLKALEAEWTLDWEQNPKALFFSLTHNLWKSDRRKQARRNMIAPSSNLDDEAETVLHSEESIEESYLQKELILEVNRIIETLPEKIRIPLTLSQSIKELESKKESVVAEYDAKITAARERIKSLEGKKKEILAPKPPRKPRKSKQQKIQEIIKLALKNGMTVEEIAGQLHVEVED